MVNFDNPVIITAT